MKEVRTFCRDVFEKLKIEQSLKDELVLAIAEAAQNIVKHAYKDNQDSNDIMVVKISCEDNKLQIAFYDMGLQLILRKLNIEKLIILNQVALVLFLFKK